MKQKLFLVLALVLCHTFSNAQIHPVYQEKLQHLFDSVCQKSGLVGASVAVLIPGDGTWTAAHGKSHAGVPITTDMYLPIGSNTKTFVACIMLQLQEQGVLGLDDTIGTWLQNIKNVNGQITIRQMLNHTSGLYNYTNHNDFFTALNNDYNHIFQPEDMLQFIDTPDFAPGTKWDYSNTGYLLAGLIIKKIMNEPFDVTVRKMILTPLGLNNTLTYPAESPAQPEPHGWTYMSNKLTDMQVDFGWTNKAFLSMASSAGAIMSTAGDNVKFWNALMTGKIINSSSMAEMKTFVPMSLGPYTGYGLALAKAVSNSRYVYAHRGTCFGYLNENLVDSETGTVITVLVNDDRPGNDWLWTNIIKPLHKITVNMPPAGVASLPSEKAFGIYPNPATDILNINLQKNATSVRYEIYDVIGKIVLNGYLEQANNSIKINNLEKGNYILRVYEPDGFMNAARFSKNN